MNNLKKLISITAVLALFSTSVHALDLDPNPTPVITNLQASESNVDPSKGETITFSFNLSKSTTLTAFVAHQETDNRFYFANNQQQNSGTVSYNWDGTDGNNNFLADGDYDFKIFANENGSVEDSATESFTLENTLSTIPLNCSSSVIDNIELNPDNDWDPTEEELQIEFELKKDVNELRVQAKKDTEIIEINDESNADEDDYEEEWDGEDDDGDYIEEGNWDIEIIADNYKCVESIDVEYEEPKIKEALVTKENFDLDYGEFTSLLFELDEDGTVTVEVYDGSKKVETLLDEEELEGDTWHEVYFDGTDDDGDELDDDEKYEFRITAESQGTSDAKDTEDISFEIEEDDSGNNSINVYGDYIEPAIFDSQQDESLTMYYCLESAAEVTIEIFDGKNASGSEEIELLTEYNQNAGCHTVEWDGTNKSGRNLSDDIYSYKITARNGSSKDTEKGRFVVGDFEDGSSSGSFNSGINNNTTINNGLLNNGISLGNSLNNNLGQIGQSCGGFWDTQNITDDELCNAINWAVAYGIINGNKDGSFKPNASINRAETVKVVLSLYPQINSANNNQNTVFTDIDQNAWYASYIQTAHQYGIMQGYRTYNNKWEARPSQTVTRAEVLKIAYTASQKFGGYNYGINTNTSGSLPWYSPYENLAYKQNIYNSQNQVNFNGAATRKEVIVFLYRLNQAGLL